MTTSKLNRKKLKKFVLKKNKTLALNPKNETALKTLLTKESKLVAKSSMQVLKEFEMLDDDESMI